MKRFLFLALMLYIVVYGFTSLAHVDADQPMELLIFPQQQRIVANGHSSYIANNIAVVDIASGYMKVLPAGYIKTSYPQVSANGQIKYGDDNGQYLSNLLGKRFNIPGSYWTDLIEFSSTGQYLLGVRPFVVDQKQFFNLFFFTPRYQPEYRLSGIYDYAWTADDNTLFYTRFEFSNRQTTLYTLDLATYRMKIIARFYDDYRLLSVAPDGQNLLFAHYGDLEVWHRATDTFTFLATRQNPLPPVWRNAEEVLYISGEILKPSLSMVNIATLDTQVLVKNLSNVWGFELSPTGNKIAYMQLSPTDDGTARICYFDLISAQTTCLADAQVFRNTVAKWIVIP